MPRIAINSSPDVVFFRSQLVAYMRDSGVTQTQLSKETGVAQYTISKFLSGRIKTVTPDVSVVLNYAINGIKFDMQALKNNPIILHALCNVWDGTDVGARVIAETLNALAPVIRSASTKKRNRING